MPGNDPAEEAVLVTAGYLAVVGAGARDERAAGWSRSTADTISLPMGAFEPVLRALVAVAVAGAGAPTPGEAAGRRGPLGSPASFLDVPSPRQPA